MGYSRKETAGFHQPYPEIMPRNLPDENLPEKAFRLRPPETPEPPGTGLEQSRRTPVCPRCHRPLGPLKHETGIAWRCAGCGGQSLNFSQFRRLIPEQHAREIWLTATEHPLHPRRRVDCPECRQEMSAVMISFHGREIELDLCQTCQRLWLEPVDGRPFRLDEET